MVEMVVGYYDPSDWGKPWTTVSAAVIQGKIRTGDFKNIKQERKPVNRDVL
jgi:hypothetical protein